MSETRKAWLLAKAAPDLLKACERILERGYVSKNIADEQDDYILLVAAIAKATGADT